MLRRFQGQRRAVGKRKLFFELAGGEERRQVVLAFAGDNLKAAAKRFSIKSRAAPW
jgi:hypothetical protein